MGINIENLIFAKKQPTKKGAIIKNLVIIGIILIVAIVSIVIVLANLGKALNDEEWNEVKTLLNQEYNESDVVTFKIGALDQNNLKTKLTASYSSVGELYIDNELNSQCLFGSTTLTNNVSFDKKDLTILTDAYLDFILEQESSKQLFSFLKLENFEVTTTGKQTNMRMCAKLNLSEFMVSEIVDFGLISTSDIPEYIYVTGLYTIDNTKPIKSCIVSSAIVVNNLSSQDNEKIFEYLQKKVQDLDIEGLKKAPAQYFFDSLSLVLENWQATANFDSTVLNVNKK